MRNFSVLLAVFLCSGCSLQTFDIPKAPAVPNQLVVFDIDGTLTRKVPHTRSVREDAVSATQLFANAGYKIIYLSARRRSFQSGIPGYLKRNDFPEGSIQVPQTSTDGNDHAAFKTRILQEFKDKGWNLFAAYGDSTTDFEAYSRVGIEKDRVFALRRAGDDSCQPGIWAKCLNSWSDHLDLIRQMVQR